MASNTYNIKIASVPSKGRTKLENGVPFNSGGGANSLLIVNEEIKTLFNEFFEKDGDLIKVKKEMYCVDGITAFGNGTVGGGSGGGTGSIASASDALFTNLATGQLMKYNGTHWVNVSQSEITPTFDNLQGKPTNFPTNTDNVSGLTALLSTLKIENLADVSLVTKANNHYLGWNGTKFVNRQIAYAEISGIPTIPANGSFAFSGLSDVQIVTPVTGNFARWNGTKWVNAMLSASDIPTHVHAGATTAANGFMSAADKMKLDGIAASANNYVHPNDANTRHVTDTEKTTWNGKYDSNNCNRTNMNWTCNILQATGIQCGHNVVDGITTDGFDSRLPSHFYRNCYDSSGNVYDHYYNSAFKGTNSQANLRVKSGSGFKALAFNGNGGFTWDDKTVYHSGNANNKDVDWACKSLYVYNGIGLRDASGQQNIFVQDDDNAQNKVLNLICYANDWSVPSVVNIQKEFVKIKAGNAHLFVHNYSHIVETVADKFQVKGNVDNKSELKVVAGASVTDGVYKRAALELGFGDKGLVITNSSTGGYGNGMRFSIQAGYQQRADRFSQDLFYNASTYYDGKIVEFAMDSMEFKVYRNIVSVGEITAYSDRRLKENIIPIESAIEKVEQLNPVRYEKDGKESIGLIAQEVKEIYPEFVLGKETEDEYLSLNYAQMNAVLIKALQELSAEVKELKSRLNAIENGI